MNQCQKPRIAPFPRLTRTYRGTFHIFPAMIPLIEILPWVLGAIGALAGGVQWMQNYVSFHHRYRKVIYIVMAVSFIGAIGIYGWEKMRVPSVDVGSTLTAIKDLPKTTTYQYAAPEFKAGQNITGWTGGRLSMAWSASSTNEFLGTPVLTGKLLLIGTFQGVLEARSLVDGALVWSVQKRQPIFTIAQVDGNDIYIGEGLHTADVSGLTKLSLDGKALWERQFGNHIESYPVVDAAHHRLWIGAGGLGLWALDTHTGDKLWWAKIGHIDVAPLFVNGHLLAAAKLSEEKDGSALFEMDADNGDVIDQVPMNGNPMGKIMDVGDGRVLVSTAIGQVGLNKPTDAGWVYGVDMGHSKKIRWMTKLATMGLPEGQLSKDKTTAYFALKNGDMVAVDTRDGHVKWSVKCGDEFKADLTLFEEGQDRLVIGITADGMVNIVDAATGKSVQSIKMTKGSYPSPVYKDGVLYLTTPHSIQAFVVGKNG